MSAITVAPSNYTRAWARPAGRPWASALLLAPLTVRPVTLSVLSTYMAPWTGQLYFQKRGLLS